MRDSDASSSSQQRVSDCGKAHQETTVTVTVGREVLALGGLSLARFALRSHFDVWPGLKASAPAGEGRQTLPCCSCASVAYRRVQSSEI
eukprot:665412-Amphidinium_carterae.2